MKWPKTPQGAAILILSAVAGLVAGTIVLNTLEKRFGK